MARKYYYLTMYGMEKVYYAKIDSLDEALEIAESWKRIRIQERRKGQSGPAKIVYEKWDGVVTTY